jgi:4-azaleucine resistance transporter AzlC
MAGHEHDPVPDRGPERQEPVPPAVTTRPLWQDVVAVAPVTLIISITFGAATVASGFTASTAVLLSAIMFSGAAQFATIGILSTGGSAFAAWTAAMLISARFGILGVAIAARFRFTGLERLVASVLLVDPNALITVAREDDRDARRAFWGLGWVLYVVFLLGTAIGALGGSVIAERFEMVAIDVALPSFLAGLVVQSMRTREARIAPWLGILVAFALLDVVRPEVAILFAPAGTLVLVIPKVRERLARSTR